MLKKEIAERDRERAVAARRRRHQGGGAYQRSDESIQWSHAIATCIYIPRGTPALLLTQYCSRDLTAVLIKNGIQHSSGTPPNTLVLASVYMPIEAQIPTRELMDLVKHCEDEDADLIIAADSNAHHSLWGSTSDNKRGEQLVSYLLTTNLTILNSGTEPTFVSSRYQTIIDLTLCSTKAADQVKLWHVSDEPSLSDHRRICYELDLAKTPTTPKRNPRKTNRLKYKSLITIMSKGNSPPDIKNADDIECNVETVTKRITSSYEQACKLSRYNTQQTPKNSWWGPDLERMRKRLRHLFNRAKNTRNEHDWEEYKEAQYKYNKRVREKANKSWQKFCTSIESNDTAARIRKILADDNTRTLGSLKKADGSYTKNSKEMSEALLETHFPGCNIVLSPNWTRERDIQPTADDWNLANRVVTSDKVYWAIDTFKPFKSGGTDGIFPALLQWGKTQLTPWLEKIYKACIAYNYIPILWREVRVVFLPKPGKSDYTSPKSFRPISLTSFLLKTLERLADRYLRDGALKHIPLHPNQNAYCTGKSTETALHSVVTKIEHDLENKLSTLGIFIDIEGAFDKTTFESIDKALSRYKVHDTLRRWIRTLLEQRVVQLDINGITKGIVARGCPQGGVLSPILWNLVVDDLITKLNAKGFYTTGYADDITILISGKLDNTLYGIAQRALHLIEKWCKENELSVNPKKTEMILFTNKRKIELPKPPTLFNTSLQLSKEVKYLGVVLDYRLNWKRHLEDKLKKSLTIMVQCKRMIGKTWGLEPKIMRWLYMAIVRRSLTYAAIIWWPRTLLTTTQKELQTFQRQACLAITSCMSTTPTTALEMLLGIPPLHIHIKEEATLGALRLRTLGLWKDQNTMHTKILKQGYHKEPRLEWKCDRIKKQHMIEKSYKIHPEGCKHLKPALDTIEVYTDGSKTRTGTGAGAYCQELNIKISQALGKDNSVFQAECVGISTAAIALANRQVTNFKININSDSQAVLKALASNTTTSQLITDCHVALEKLAASNDITLRWIKGHDGDLGNEAADTLARKATTLEVVGPEPIVPIPFSEYKSWLHELTLNEHTQLWGNATDCRQTREALPNINKRLTNKLLHLNRANLRKVVGILTGHCPLNKHLYVLGITDSPLCRGCMETDETPSHVLLDCTSVSNQRSRFLGSPASLHEAIGNLGGLLSFWGDLGWLE